MAESPRPSEPRYQLQEQLGRGGMSVVSRAEQTSLGRKVAVKYLHPERVDDELFIELLKREAAVLAQLDHPNIVPVYDFGQDAEGQWFYSMKEVRGRPWNRELKKDRTSKSHEAFLRENIDILLSVADAIAFAHTKDISHLDLKPANIMLGEFGEVLVTDWGVAKTPESPPDDREVGTPEYAAPEMAQGIFDEIGPHSDIYLLGAILFEIVTGKEPHLRHRMGQGFFNAAKNTIVEVDEVGELMDIAMQAMATDPAERYPDVAAFQKAIRDYQEHSESIRLAENAHRSLEDAKATTGYSSYQAAVFGFENALGLWLENKVAEAGISEARIAYASRALDNDDFDLGLGLLDPGDDSHAELIDKLKDAKRERDARQERLKRTRQVARVLGWTAFIAVTTGLVVSAYYWQDATKQRGIAEGNELEAKRQARKATEQREIAEGNEKEAKQQAFLSELGQDLQEVATDLSIKQGERAERRRKEANEARRAARQAELETREEAYLSLVGGAAARIEDNSFEEASNLLELARQLERGQPDARVAIGEENLREWVTKELGQAHRDSVERATELEVERQAKARIDKMRDDLQGQLTRANNVTDDDMRRKLSLRNWEWGHLAHLANQSSRDIEADTPLDLVAFAPDGEHFITGGEDGKIRWWSVGEPDSTPHAESLDVEGYIFAADFHVQPSGVGQQTYFAVGGNEKDKFLRLWKWDARESLVPTGPAQVLTGHTDAVTSVEFSSDGQLLLTSSYDGTSRVWHMEDGKLLATQQAHTGPVWDAEFAPSENHRRQFVTVGDDGVAIVWELGQSQDPGSNHVWKPKWEAYGNHFGAVYAASFVDGNRLATAGSDQRIVVWDLPVDEEASGGRSPGEQDQPLDATAQFTLQGHTAAIRTLRPVPDSNMLLSAGDDNTIRIWNLSSARIARVLRGHSGNVRSCDIALSSDPSQQLVLSGSHDGTAQLWRVAAHQEALVFGAHVIRSHREGVLTSAFSADGASFVTAGLDRRAQVHEFDDQFVSSNVTLAEGHQFAIRDARFHEDGRLITSSVDDTVRVWNEQGHEIATLRGTGRAGALAVSRDWIATGSNPSERADAFTAPQVERRWERYTRLMKPSQRGAWGIQIWSAAADSDQERADQFWTTFGEVTALAFSADGQRLFSGHANGRCMLWQLHADGPKLLWGLEAQHQPVPAAVTSAAFLSDGRVLSATNFGTITVWNGDTGELLPQPPMEETEGSQLFLRGFAASSGGASDRLAVKYSTGPIWVVELPRGVAGSRVESATVAAARVTRPAAARLEWQALPSTTDLDIGNLDLSPSGRWLVASKPNARRALKRILTWDLDSLFSPDGNDRPAEPHELTLSEAVSESFDRLDAAYFDDQAGEQLGVLTVGGTSVRRWRAEAVEARSQWVELARYGPHSAILSARFSPTGKWIATAGLDERVEIWDRAGQVHAELRHDARINSLAFTTAGNRLQVVTGTDDGLARLWDVGPADESTVRGATSPTVTFDRQLSAAIPTRVVLAFDTAAGRRILTASDDGKAFLWDDDGRMRPEPVAQHGAAILSAAVSADGSLLVTGSADNTALLWDVVAGEQIFLEQGEEREAIELRHTGRVIAVAFSPDGSRIITGSDDTTAKIWDRATGRELITLRGHARPVTSVAFQPETGQPGPRHVLTTSRDGAAILWPAQDWREGDAAGVNSAVAP